MRGENGRRINYCRGLLLTVGTLACLHGAAIASDYLSEAQRLIASGQLRAAEIVLKNAVRADQSDMNARYRLAVIELQLGEGAAAEHDASLARSGGFEPTKVVPLLAETYLAQGKYVQLLHDFPGTEGDAEEKANILVARGYAQLALKQPDQAESSFNQAQDLLPNSPKPILAQAKLQLSRGRLAAAESAVDHALQLDAKSKEALVEKAHLRLVQGNPEEALKLVDTALAEDSGFVAGRLERAQILLSQRRDQDAKPDVDAALASQPGNPGAIYLRALLEARAKNFDRASAELQKISKILGAIPNGYYVQAAVLYNLHQLDQAAEAAQRHVARSPDDLAGHKLLGLIELALGRPDKTIETLAKLDTAGLADAATLDLLGRAYTAVGQPVQATDAFNRAVKLAPTDPELRLRLGAVQLHTGDLSDATKDLKQSFDLAPSAPAAEMLIVADLAAGNWQEAVDTVEALRKSQPASPVPDNLLGLVKLARFDLDGAQTQFSDLSKAHPDYLPARLNLTRVLLLQGKTTEAENTLRQMLTSEPGNAAVLGRLVALLLLQGKTEDAVTAAAAAHKAAPGNSQIVVDLIDLYLRAGRKDEALALARQVSADDTVANFPLIAALGRAEAAAGFKNEALQTYQRLIAIAPSRSDLRIEYAAALQSAGDQSGARRTLDDAMKLSPNEPRLAAAVISLALKAGGLEAALSTAEELKKSNPNLPTAAALDGDVYMAAGKPDKAADAYATAFERGPSAMLAIRLARAKSAQGDADAATEVLRSWLAKNPNDHSVAVMLASYDIASQRYADATKRLEAVLAREPENVVALNNLAWLYDKAGDPRARETAERAYLLSPNLPQIADTLGWILVKEGSPASAIGLLAQAHASPGVSPAVHYHFAVALNDVGRRTDALHVLEELTKSKAAFDEEAAAKKLLAELAKG